MPNAFPGDRSDSARLGSWPSHRPHARPAGREYALESLEARLLFAAGDLDPSFSVDGVAATSFEGYSWSAGNAVVVQADGRIVVAGDAAVNGHNDFGVARYMSDGTLDRTLAGTGRVTVSPLSRMGYDPRGNESPTTVAVQADGKIIVGGFFVRFGETLPHWALTRFNPDGSVDPLFAAIGVHLDVLGVLTAIRLDGEGRIVCAGTSGNNAAVVRFRSTGALDRSFNRTGGNFFPMNPSQAQPCAINALAIQPDGKIVIGGSATGDNAGGFALARLNTDGTLDGDFGVSGRVQNDEMGRAGIHALAVAPDGRIWAGGQYRLSDTLFTALTRYRPDGSLDPAVGRHGGIGGRILGLTVQPDGKPVFVGHIDFLQSPTPRAFVGRLRADNGSFDTTFGDSVWSNRYVDFAPSPASSSARAVALQPDGRIVVAGWGRPTPGGRS